MVRGCSHDDGYKGEFLVYEEGGWIKINVWMEDETVSLTQQMMAELFQSSKQNISHHIQNIYDEGELLLEGTVKKYLTVQQRGGEVSRLASTRWTSSSSGPCRWPGTGAADEPKPRYSYLWA